MYHGCTSRVRAATRPALRSALAGAGERFPSGRRRPLRMRQVRGKAAVFTDSGQLDGPGRKQRAGQPLFLGQSQVGELPLHVEADPESAPTAAAEPGTRVAFAFETSVRFSSMPAAVRAGLAARHEAAHGRSAPSTLRTAASPRRGDARRPEGRTAHRCLAAAPASIHRPPCHFRATLTGTEGCPTVSDGTEKTGSDKAIFKLCQVAATGQLTFFFAKVRVAGSNPVVRSNRSPP
jgi:hypothetical protein